MKKLFNSLNRMADDMIDGFVAAYPTIVARGDNPRVVRRSIVKPCDEKVTLLIGNGCGHEPIAMGFVGEGLLDDGTVVSGQFGVSVTGSSSRIANGSTASVNIIDSSSLAALSTETQWKLFATTDLGGVAASGLAQGSGVYDPRASANKLAGDDKALAICEVCWIIPDEPPERQDVALQPDGLVESSVYTSTSPS